ncbi:MAG: amidohydrolase family protein [Acidobacteria bacterium]|nr:amidohydrolase family protein [Acidobacteriota bacterium]
MKNAKWLLILTAFLVSSPFILAQKKADLILYNAKVVTVDSNFTIAEAVAVRDTKILAVGKNDEVLRLADEATQKIDLKGKTVIPGLIDTHSHFHSYGRSHYRNSMPQLPEYQLAWDRVKTKDDVLAQIAETIKKNNIKPGELVFFTSPNFSFNPKAPTEIFYEELTMKELDKVTPNNPVIVSMGSGLRIYNGICLVNGKFMNFLFDKYGDFIRKYGRYWKDGNGNPTGILESPISQLIEHQMLPRSRAEDLAPMLKLELQEWSAMGVTAVSSRMDSMDVEALNMLDRNKELKVRIPYGMSDFFAVDDPEATFTRMGNLIGLGSSKLWINSFTPIIVDGGEANRATDQRQLKPHAKESKYFPIGNPYLDTEYRGASANYYEDWFTQVARNGGRVANMHTGGDRSVRRMIEILEKISREVPLKDRRWALDHCSMVNPAHIDRAVKLGIFFSCGPTFIEDSPELEEVYGPVVANTFIVPVKTMLDKGAKVVFQMDRHRYIWSDLELFFTRNVEGKVWGPQERIDKVTGLKMITRWAAEYILREKELGSLEPGKLADIAVLDRDYLTIADDQVSEIQALMTICDGEIVHLHPQFSQEYNLKSPGATVATYKELYARR